MVNNIFSVSLNIHLTDILVKEALTDSPLLIIKENVTCGFTGQLKGWWDHYLNNDDRNGILTAVKRETDGSVIMTDR